MVPQAQRRPPGMTLFSPHRARFDANAMIATARDSRMPGQRTTTRSQSHAASLEVAQIASPEKHATRRRITGWMPPNPRIRQVPSRRQIASAGTRFGFLKSLSWLYWESHPTSKSEAHPHPRSFGQFCPTAGLSRPARIARRRLTDAAERQLPSEFRNPKILRSTHRTLDRDDFPDALATTVTLAPPDQ